MAPSYANADLAYRQASELLRTACTVLEFHLPSSQVNEAGESFVFIPSARPRPRADSVVACEQCAEELENAEAGQREGHQCTHQPREVDVRQHGDRITDDGVVRKRQPSPLIIRQDLTDVKEKFETCTKALSTLCSVTDHEEAESLSQHILLWAEYIADLRARAGEVLTILEAPVTAELGGQASSSHVLVDQPIAAITYTQAQLNNALGAVISSADNPVVHTSEQQILVTSVGATPVVPQPLAASQGTGDTGTTVANRRVAFDLSSLGPNNAPLDLAMRSLLHVRDTIGNDLLSMEEEISSPEESLTIAALDDLKEFCVGIDVMIKKDLKEAAEKVASLDTAGITGAAALTASCLTDSTRRLRSIQASIRRARMAAVLSSESNSSRSNSSGTPSRRKHSYIRQL